jgi:hypothetical protein
LQVVAHVREFDFIKRVEVWHPTDARDKDPVLVAVERNKEYDWMNGPLYILARWGDALKSVDQLSAEASKIWAAKVRSELATILNTVQSEIASIEDTASAAFLTGKAKTYSFHVSNS